MERAWFRYGLSSTQPFFEENIPDSRLEEACKESEKNGMAIEMEFDSRALSDYEPVSFRSRMKSYIDVFKDNGVFLIFRLHIIVEVEPFMKCINPKMKEIRKSWTSCVN